MNQPTNSKLGLSLLIDAGIVISAVIAGTTVWNKVEWLDKQFASSVTAERIAKLEGKVERLDDKIDRNVNDLLKIDENSKKDRDQLHDNQNDLRRRIEALERPR